ncbi:hypothetical protein GO283_04655 [Ralstonia solanacearum]|nr:hypothetical protein [Ralstonia solanacearum]NJZ80218.1 hypothetical protein [Ralstonia solanacearum]NJZ81106.1 hypothetical protein [Ralstonia solanacearum]NKA04462.1 hypothetical protein [Ralstonia solanacearum]NKA36623.1 hypothetical protein [Ralstonia solanacearum]
MTILTVGAAGEIARLVVLGERLYIPLFQHGPADPLAAA